LNTTDNPQARSFAALDAGPWHYHTEPQAAEHVHRYFVESSACSPDVRLYINGNFGDASEIAAYGQALAQALNGLARGTPVLAAGTRQLDALRSLAGMASSFPTELSKSHPEVVEAFAALAAAEDTAAQVQAHKEADGNFNTGHEDLDLLLGLTEDMALGHANMDTGMLWLDVLGRLQAQLGVKTPPAP
jgi:hypothetical protein